MQARMVIKWCLCTKPFSLYLYVSCLSFEGDSWSQSLDLDFSVFHQILCDFTDMCWACTGLILPCRVEHPARKLRRCSTVSLAILLSSSEGLAQQWNALLCFDSGTVSSRQNLASGSSVLASIQAI